MKAIDIGDYFETKRGLYQLISVNLSAGSCYNQITVKRVNVEGYKFGSFMNNEYEWLKQRGFEMSSVKRLMFDCIDYWSRAVYVCLDTKRRYVVTDHQSLHTMTQKDGEPCSPVGFAFEVVKAKASALQIKSINKSAISLLDNSFDLVD